MKIGTVITGMLLPIIAMAAPTPSANGIDTPNVVIIYADDMGYGDLNVNYPASKIPTPNLDQLAREGMRFTDGHSSSGVCSPSRFAMLTGQHHWRRFHQVVRAMGPSEFKPSDFTLPELFNTRGYNTACIGKWHLGWDWEAIRLTGKWRANSGNQPSEYDWSKPVPGGPCDQGFDYYYGDGTINFPPYTWVENDRLLYEPTFMIDPEKIKRLDPKDHLKLRNGPAAPEWNPYEVLPTLADKAVEWIGRQSADQPFFLYFPLSAPHAPIIPNQEFRGTSEAGTYGDFMVQTDDVAGRVLQALKANGFAENTLVVFTADNGAEQYAYDRERQFGHWSSGPFRGVKRDVWEGGHRVPFIVRWPGQVAAGVVSDEVISQVDLFATFAAVLGHDLQPDQAKDSYNLLPLLQGKRYTKPLRKATVQNTYEESYGLRQGDWMFINASTGDISPCPDSYLQVHGYTKETTPGLLYNLKTDPAQHRNLYVENPERVKEMERLLNRYIAGEGCAPHAAK